MPVTFSVAPAGAVTLPLSVMSPPLVNVTVEPAPAVIEPVPVTVSAPLVARLVLPVVSTAALMVVVPAEGVADGAPVAPCDLRQGLGVEAGLHRQVPGLGNVVHCPAGSRRRPR